MIKQIIIQTWEEEKGGSPPINDANFKVSDRASFGSPPSSDKKKPRIKASPSQIKGKKLTAAPRGLINPANISKYF